MDKEETNRDYRPVIKLIKQVLQFGLNGITQLEQAKISLKTVILRIVVGLILVIGLLVSLWIILMGCLYTYLIHIPLSHLDAWLILLIVNLLVLAIVLIWLNVSQKRVKSVVLINCATLVRDIIRLFTRKSKS